MSSVTIRTPAKLNLGLEVIAPRTDGYHDLCTIYQAISIYDELKICQHNEFAYVSDPRIPEHLDLARSAMTAGVEKSSWSGRVRLIKLIPIAAGLGGGSSDAALILRMINSDNTGINLNRKAASIGADVPFFVIGGTALATGIGDILQPIDTPNLWFVVVVPDLEIAGKTARLFQGLQSIDFSDGTRVRALAQSINEWNSDLPATFPNAFERQMREFPEVDEAWKLLDHIAGRVALSGAGPAMYSWHASEDEALNVASQLEPNHRFRVLVARAVGPHCDDPTLRAFKGVLESAS